MQSQEKFRRTWLVHIYLWATELLYGPLAWAYDAVAWLVSFGYWSRWRLDALAYRKPGRILEIGFGTGELLIALAEGGQDVTGLELSAQMQRMTGRKLQKHRLDIKRVRGSTGSMPFLNDYFDTIISTFPSNYIFAGDTLREIRRIMHPDGCCVVVGLGVQFKSGIKRWLTQIWMGSASEHLVQHFLKEAQRMGFQVTCLTHQAETYTQPVVILEISDAN